MNKTVLIFLVLIFSSQHIFAGNVLLDRKARSSSNFKKCAKDNLGKCDFYTKCLEKYNSCGKNGYALSYGNKYCKRFNAYEGSAYYKKWMRRTTTDLQKALISYVGDRAGKVPCEEITTFAFDSHAGAYLKLPTDVCKLDTKTAVDVVTTVDGGDFLSRAALKQFLKVAGVCIARLTDEQPYSTSSDKLKWWKDAEKRIKTRLGTCCELTPNK